MNPYQKYNPLQQKKTKKSLSREPKEQLTEFQKVFLKAEKLYKSAVTFSQFGAILGSEISY